MTPFWAPWESAENAAGYAAFCRRFDLYHKGSEELARLVDLASARRVMDLACGTGSTTAVVLSKVGDNASVIGVDVSEAMLAEARRVINDPRVEWARAEAEEVDTHVDPPLDAVLCTAAMWQTDLGRTFPAVRRLPRREGFLAFDIAAGFVEVPGPAPPPLPPTSLGFAYMDAANELYHLEPGRRRRSAYTVEAIRDALRAASLELRTIHVADLEATPEEMRAWLEIPIHNDRFGGQLTREQRGAAMALAWDRLAADRPREVVRDVFFAATAV